MALTTRRLLSSLVLASNMTASSFSSLTSVSCVRSVNHTSLSQQKTKCQQSQVLKFKKYYSQTFGAMATTLLDTGTPIISLEEAHRFMKECLEAMGTPTSYADAQAALLVEADYRGHYSHGMNRIDMYIDDIKSGTCVSTAFPKILKESPATAWVDGQNGLGAVVGNFCMELAMKKAKEVGVGWVCAKRTPIISLEEAHRFMKECLEAMGTPTSYADAQAALLVEADYRGHYSHGMNRIDMYIDDIKSGTCVSTAFPKILKESPATAWVDGQNGLGAVVGNFCMELAMKKAKEVGVGWVCAKHSNHYGIAGWYTMQAVKQGLVGLSFSNTSPFMTPTRGIDAALGTNPLSFAAPATNSDSFVLDMATTAVAVGKIEIQRRKGAPIPSGWAQDSQGNITTDAEVAFNSAALMPLGGAEINSGYKGFGLGLMVEVLCGILSGAKYGSNVRKWGSHQVEDANLGQCFIAMDPSCFAPGFEGRMSDIMDTIRNMRPANPDKPILIAGDPERLHMKAVDEAGGVKYLKNQMETCARLAEKLGVRTIQPRSA